MPALFFNYMRYLVKSTGCIIELDRIQKGAKPILHFKYINKDKPNFTCYQEHVDRSLSFEVWIKYQPPQ